MKKMVVDLERNGFKMTEKTWRIEEEGNLMSSTSRNLNKGRQI